MGLYRIGPMGGMVDTDAGREMGLNTYWPGLAGEFCNLVPPLHFEPGDQVVSFDREMRCYRQDSEGRWEQVAVSRFKS